MDDAFDEARKMSEPAFRNQLLAWMQTKDVSQRIQAKLRRDMIECFSATTLGREIEMRQRQFGKRQVPAASILALNTLVAEFLFSQNCQFTLSVFASEVPYQGTIPDFESGPIDQIFRFSPSEQRNLLNSLGVSKPVDELIRKQYAESACDPTMNSSLLYQVLVAAFPSHDQLKLPTGGSTAKSTQCNVKTHFRSLSRSSNKCLHRVRSHVNKFTRSIVDIIDSMGDTSQPESPAQTMGRIMRLFRGRRHRFGRLKTKLENNKLRQVVDSIFELCSEMERCLSIFKVARHHEEAAAEELKQSARQMKASTDDVRYSDWVRELKNSTNGKRFLQHLIEHCRRVRQKEVDAQMALLAEEIKSERARLKLHYKQRFIDRCQGMVMVSTASTERVVEHCGVQDHTSVPLVDSSVQQSRSHKKYLELSNRKLPEIEISPSLNPTAGKTDRLKDKTIDTNVANLTRQRVEQLVAQSDDIELSIQARLQQHTIDAEAIAGQGRYIKQQSNLGKQLIHGVHTTRRKITLPPQPVKSNFVEDVSEKLDNPASPS